MQRMEHKIESTNSKVTPESKNSTLIKDKTIETIKTNKVRLTRLVGPQGNGDYQRCLLRIAIPGPDPIKKFERRFTLDSATPKIL